tara:strand:- start:5527 stop:6066 length:540 start_codon:yes stop_codon:yes gene_type:complete
MSKKISDAFKAYRPKTQDVAVGEDILSLKTATLDQETRFLSILDSLDVGDLLQAITSITPDPNDPQGGTILKIAESGPQIWKAARNVLGKQFAPAVQSGAIVMLDTYANMDVLVKNGKIEDRDPEYGSDGEYLGSKNVRAYIKANLTLIQGIQIIKTAWNLNSYGEIVGKMIPIQAEGA